MKIKMNKLGNGFVVTLKIVTMVTVALLMFVVGAVSLEAQKMTDVSKNSVLAEQIHILMVEGSNASMNMENSQLSQPRNIQQMLQQGKIGINKHTITTGNNTFVYLHSFNFNWLGLMSKKRYYKLDPNSTISITYDSKKNKHELRVEKGKLWEDKELKSAAKLTEMMSFCASVNRTKIQKDVNAMKAKDSYKNNRDKKDANAKLVNEIIKAKTAKGGAVNAITGLAPGPLAAPVGMGNILATWIIQAEMAFAIACVYGTPPNHDEFTLDLMMLFGGDNMVRETVASFGTDMSKTAISSATSSVGTKAIKKHLTAANKKKMMEVMGEKMTKSFASAATGTVKIFPIATLVFDVAKSGKEAQAFGGRAKIYYE